MKKIQLKEVEHEIKVGHSCGNLEPNIVEDCLFMDGNEVIGFYIREMPKKAAMLADIADHELRSPRVPKGLMKRSSGFGDESKEVLQYSTILGAVPPKPHMKRNYATISSVHNHKQAQDFIKAMILLAEEASLIIKEIMPKQHKQQQELIKMVDEKWRFTDMFTSSISNYNIAADYHRDSANIVGTVNAIITKRKSSKGGNLNVPDYDATIDQCDNSLLVYPAWRNIHGVTPILPKTKQGYRNSLVFYALKAFLKE